MIKYQPLQMGQGSIDEDRTDTCLPLDGEIPEVADGSRPRGERTHNNCERDNDCERGNSVIFAPTDNALSHCV